MRVFIIGAAGGIGRRLSSRLVARGDEVSGMHRAPAQGSTIAATGATPIAGDLIADSPARLAELLRGHDAVVFSAGAHGTGMDQTTRIDGEGLEKAAAATSEAGVRRFVLVSAFPEAGRAANLGEGFEHYMRVKKAADVHLCQTDLDWVIVRPGTLRDGAGDGRVHAGLAIDYGTVHRENVAAFIAAVLADERLNRIIVELTDGDVPAEVAVTQLAEGGSRSLRATDA